MSSATPICARIVHVKVSRSWPRTATSCAPRTSVEHISPRAHGTAIAILRGVNGKDGYDTVEWLAEQPWSNGKIGTFGSSQGGYAQNFLAVTQPPHLVTQYMIDTGLSLFHEGYRIGGATKPNRFKTMARICRVPEHNDRWLRETFEHPVYDEYWEQEDCTLHFDKMNVSAFTVGSWYDYMSRRLNRQLRRPATPRRTQLARRAEAAARPLAARPLQQTEPEGRRIGVSRKLNVRREGSHGQVVRPPPQGHRQRRGPRTHRPLLRHGRRRRIRCPGQRMARGR